MHDVGFRYLAVTKESAITCGNDKVEEQVGPITFTSVTVRAFKLDSVEDKCEDFGQTATYKGTISEHAEGFEFDLGHYFKKGEALKVCGNTADFLSKTRFAPHFDVTERGLHRGLFGEACCTKKQAAAGCCDGAPKKEESKGCCSGPAKKCC